MTDGDVRPELDHENGRKLSFAEMFTYSFGELGVSLSPAIVAGWLIYFYTGRMADAGSAAVPMTGIVLTQQAPMFLVSAWGIAFLGLFGRLVDSIADPLVGYYSDKWRFKRGRRIPWVLWGTPLLALFSILIWMPPESGGIGTVWFNVGPLAVTPNFLWIAFMLSGFWFFYTVVVAPYLALLPEITPFNRERIRVSEAMAYQDVVAMVIGTIGLGAILEAFGAGLTIGPITLDNGYEVAGIILAVIFTLCFFISISLVRETEWSASKAVPFKFLQAMIESIKNPAFPPYVISVSFLRLGIDIVVALIPFMVINVMGFGEGLAGGLQGVIVIAAAVLFPLVSKLAARHGKKKIFSIGLAGFGFGLVMLSSFYHAPFIGWIVSFVASLFGAPLSNSWIMFAHCLGVMFLISFPIATALVLPRPIYADVMDHDEKLTGYRREAMYNGMEGLITKFAAGMAAFIVPLLNQYLGITAERPWGGVAGGLIGGVMLFLAWWAFKYYRIET
ncbi:MFS transporter [bacterium]|nr:MFS transporter [bacterium]